MKERGIIMSGDNPTLILNGSKTETRRRVTDPELVKLFDFLGGPADDKESDGLRVSFVEDFERTDQSDGDKTYSYTGLLVQSEACPEDGAEEITCPYGVAGDRLYMREAHWQFGKWIRNGINEKGKGFHRLRWKFLALAHDVRFDEPLPSPERGKKRWHKRPSIFMPKWATRAWLELLSVSVERVQDITTEDGVIAEGIDLSMVENQSLPIGYAAKLEYATLWDSLHGKGAWERNDWVWVLKFKKL